MMPSSAARRRQAGRSGVGELVPPGGGGLAHGDRLLERARRRVRPRQAALVHEAGAHAQLVGIGMGVGADEHDALAGAREHRVEQAPLVLQALAVALGVA